MLMSAKAALITGSIFGFLSVAIGAFGAHALKTFLLENNRLATFETAVQYQMYHGMAILLCGIMGLLMPKTDFSIVTWLFFSGILIFSGSLYLLCATGIKWLGAITPLGGTAFLAAWLLMAWKVFTAEAG
jgi:uncharacterized membrane protein YgdD (TMEM256/DUF423 family)